MTITASAGPSVNTPEEIRAYLIKQGILPSPEEAKKTFWSLGKDAWKQLIDGCAHKYGPMVFDRGLHGGFREPGYLAGIEAASHFFTDNFDKPFSLDLYKAIHAHACSHFATSRPYEESGVIENSANNTYRTIQIRATYGIFDYQPIFHEMQQSMVLSDMRNTVAEAKCALDDEEARALIANLSLEVTGYYRHIASKPAADRKSLQKRAESALHEAKKLLESLSHPNIPDDPKAICSALYKKEEEFRPKIYQLAESYVEKMNKYFEIITFGLSLTLPFVQCVFRTARTFYIIYPPSTPSRQEHISQKIIDQFNWSLLRLQKKTCTALQAGAPHALRKQKYQDKVCRLIADLFAQLEWAHPWTDGQGRTDLVVLNGLLCQEGLHPAILESPYYSSGCPLDQWLTYLKAGLKKWEEVKG